MQTKQKYITDLGFISAIYMLTIVDFVVKQYKDSCYVVFVNQLQKKYWEL